MPIPPRLADAIREQLTGGRQWPSPLDLACDLDPRIRCTPALELVNAALVEAFNTPDARLAISIAPQEGKGLALDTPIATPTGWTLNGDLRAGDTIFGGDGRPCTVTMAHPPRLLDCYKLTFQSGATLVADGDHRWLVQDRYTKTPNGRKWIVTDTRTIAKNPRRYGVPTTPALTLPNAQLPIDPYVFGAWLGDGHSLSCRITTGAQDEQILDHIRAAGIRVTRVGSSITWKLEDPAPQTERRSPLRAKLQDLGVWGNKHIPTTYLRGSVEQRLALLQGLMDTDGSAYANESGDARCEFTTVSEQLAADVLTLARSLGIHAASHESRATLYGRDISARWRIRFTTDLPVFRLERKLARIQADSRKLRRQNGIMSVERVPSVWTRCLTVDSPDRTYLAGRDLIPTHNTTLAVVNFIVWALQQEPDLPIVLGTYNQSLANRGGRLIRNTIEANPQLGIRIADDNGAKHEWSIAGKHGGLVSAGRGVGISGRPAGLIVVDDPFKEGEAQSETIREQAWDWWTEALSARLTPGAAVVIVHTRWHTDDLIGRLLERDAHADWKYINIPAQCEDPATDPLGRTRVGEFMVSARGRSQRQWEQRKLTVGSRVWNALYQGRPAPAEGGMVKRDWWQYYEQPLWVELDSGARRTLGMDQVLISADLTFKGEANSDYVVIQVWGRRGANAYLLDQIRGRWDFPETIRRFESLCAKWPDATLKIIEDKANGPAVIATLRHRIPGIIGEIPQGSKEARVAAVSPVIEAHNAHLPASALAPWVDDFIEEWAGFPNAANDDMVDAGSQALNRLLLQPLLTEQADEWTPLAGDYQIINY